MGSNQGVIWNDSPFPIQYIVYGKFEELMDESNQYQVDPHLKLGTNKGELSGFKLSGTSGIKKKYARSFVTVMPDRHSTSGLSKLKMDQHKISVRVVIEKFEKFLLSDVVIKAQTDMCLKIRGDLSIKNMMGQQAAQLIQQDKMKSESWQMMEAKIKYQQSAKKAWLQQLRCKFGLAPQFFTEEYTEVTIKSKGQALYLNWSEEQATIQKKDNNSYFNLLKMGEQVLLLNHSGKRLKVKKGGQLKKTEIDQDDEDFLFDFKLIKQSNQEQATFQIIKNGKYLDFQQCDCKEKDQCECVKKVVFKEKNQSDTQKWIVKKK